jgi:hypothetical protein
MSIVSRAPNISSAAYPKILSAAGLTKSTRLSSSTVMTASATVSIRMRLRASLSRSSSTSPALIDTSEDNCAPRPDRFVCGAVNYRLDG